MHLTFLAPRTFAHITAFLTSSLADSLASALLLSYLHKAPTVTLYKLFNMMNRFVLVIVAIFTVLSTAAAFAPTKSAFTGSRVAAAVTRSNNSQLNMIFGPPKDDGKPGDYVCLVRSLFE